MPISRQPLQLTHHDIYDAVLDDHAFSALPARIAGAMGVSSCFMLWHHPDNDREFMGDTHAEVNETYAAEFAEHDIWYKAGFQPEHLGRVTRLSELVPEETYRASIYYNEFIRPNRLDKYWCMAIGAPTRDGTAVLALHRGAREGDFDDASAALLERHSGDINRMMRIRRELERNAPLGTEAAEPLLDEAMPGFELDAEARLLRLNAGADTLLRAHPAFRIRRGGTLAVIPALAQDFSGAITRATRPDTPEASVLDLPAIPRTDRIGKRPYLDMTLNIMPRGAGTALVVVTSQSAGELRGGLYDFEEKASLSPREVEILSLVSEGLRRDRVAHELDLALATVDMHLANARRKLGAMSLAHAVRLALTAGII